MVLKRVIKSVSLQVEEGKSLFDSLSSQPGFTKLYCALVKAGESAGILDSILNKLAEFLEKQEKLKNLEKVEKWMVALDLEQVSAQIIMTQIILFTTHQRLLCSHTNQIETNNTIYLFNYELYYFIF